MKRQNQQKGFTLIEILMAMVVLSMLSFVVFPRFYDMARRSHEAMRVASLTNIRAAISFERADRLVVNPESNYVTSLDANENNTDCETCFSSIMHNPIKGTQKSGWSKVGSNTYFYSGGFVEKCLFTYNSADGSFQSNQTECHIENSK